MRIALAAVFATVTHALLIPGPIVQQPFGTWSDASPPPDAPQSVRIAITSPSSTGLSECSLPGDRFHSGYAHYTNATGSEDKHLFFSFFEARGANGPEKPVLLTFGGGPGTSGLANTMSGLGCARYHFIRLRVVLRIAFSKVLVLQLARDS